MPFTVTGWIPDSNENENVNTLGQTPNYVDNDNLLNQQVAYWDTGKQLLTGQEDLLFKYVPADAGNNVLALNQVSYRAMMGQDKIGPKNTNAILKRSPNDFRFEECSLTCEYDPPSENTFLRLGDTPGSSSGSSTLQLIGDKNNTGGESLSGNLLISNDGGDTNTVIRNGDNKTEIFNSASAGTGIALGLCDPFSAPTTGTDPPPVANQQIIMDLQNDRVKMERGVVAQNDFNISTNPNMTDLENRLNFYSSGTLTTSFSPDVGSGPGTTYRFNITRIGNLITITLIDNISDYSVSGGFIPTYIESDNSLPTWARPDTGAFHDFVVYIEVGSKKKLGTAYVTTAGSIRFNYNYGSEGDSGDISVFGSSSTSFVNFEL